MNIQERRNHVAALGERHALAILDMPLGETREMALAALRQLTHERDVLDQQAAWVNRRNGWVVPSTPAWTD
jgi:hypothetical protein